MSNKQISPERKGVYYVGLVLTVIGFLTFGSVFVSAVSNFGNFDNFHADTRSVGFRAIVGMGMMFVGKVLMNTGRMGLAGSGLMLDPEAAREDVEPWSRMSGGVLKDTLDEADIHLGKPALGADSLPFDERLRRLKKLRDDNLLSEAEYVATRKKILDQA